MRILIDKGFDINAAVKRRSRYGTSPAICGAKMLKKGLTPLHAGALFGRSKAVILLLTRGADAGACDDSGAIPLHLALSRRLDSQNVGYDCQTDQHSKIHWVATGHFNDAWTIDEQMPEHIWDYDDEIRNEIISRNAADRRAVIRESLLRAPGAASRYADAAGRTALHHVNYCEYESAFETVDFLLRQNHSATVKDNQGITPVHLAARAGDTASLQALVKEPKSLTIQDCSGLNALHHAVKHGHVEATEYILSAGRNLLIHWTTDNLGRTALHHGAGEISSLSMVELLLGYDIDVTHRDSKGRDPLAHHLTSRVAFGSDPSLIGVLLKHGANARHLDPDGQNLAHLYVNSGCEFQLYGLLLLEDAGVDLSEVDTHDRTILHTAAKAGSLNTELLAHMDQCVRMNLKQVDKYGKCFIDYIKEEQATQKPHGLFREDRWEKAERAWTSYSTQNPAVACECGQRSTLGKCKRGA